MRINPRQIQSLSMSLLTGSPQKRLYAGVTLLLILLFAGWQQYAPPASGKVSGRISGTVVGVADGDTITVLDAMQRQHKIRFAFVDAPEKAQPYGQAAKQALAAKVFRQQVSIDVIEQDKYGRNVGRVWLNGEDINYSQLAEGLAWHYQFFARKNQSQDEFARYDAAQQQAQQQRLGLWQGVRPVPPWDFRRARKQAADGE